MKKTVNSQKGGSCDLGACPLQMGGAKQYQKGAGSGCGGSNANKFILSGGSKKNNQKGGSCGCSNNNRKPVLQMGGSKKIKRIKVKDSSRWCFS
jgi:hypothetical protein